ncbi:DNA-binding transcription factor YAP1 [Cyberlindnera jadinii NRRL Y-1542]|uniref:AP-1-like transcription factor n=1 Tax=Cyberlindnera jadinii (strain ATCC 18201 / CBS 1600 / BCRC 20928 / JCM 3617 / NBRC 0987 / NRRL Y-1542) TaxID=983966 RepID=A0A1E4RUH1_CYBJN|nr:AP-1-like transcription factor [Cyberlindnera jadinii NRRL Y-1542]ODV70927.1 AP-1-like transcription factor [Cyberlindnera jadinii NRRL Y-1542]
MTEYAKRHTDSLLENPESKRPEPDATATSEGVLKKPNKPGRKPLDTEPKNKRTAQNRAAQRAFRERKERKMKELEEKITTLEDEKRFATTESEFLRLQVQMLTQELAKHRGTTDLSDLKLPLFTSPTETNSTPNSEVSTVLTSVGSDNELKRTQQEFSFEFPWSRKSSTTNSKRSPNASNASSNNVPTLASDASTCSSQSSPFDLYNSEEQNELPLFNKVVKDSTKMPTEKFNFSEHFDEGVNFCSDLGKACGTRECPIPEVKSNTNTPLPVELDHNDPLNSLEDPALDFNFGTFDPTVAFANESNYADLFDSHGESDPLAGLVTEESAYDPFSMFKDTHARVVERREEAEHVEVEEPQQEQEQEQEQDPDVVPSNEHRLMKCTEIWDRITSHPKYADIDIDGLCSELRSKAKCSDKGVVIDYKDVNQVIQRNIRK